MVSRGRRDADIRRHKPKREPKHRILIVAEGKATERHYFSAFRQKVKNPLVHVEVARETGVPVTVVEIAKRERDIAAQRAKEEKDENLLWNEVWAVIDVDEHPNLEAAQKAATESSIRMAVSNPCFELWLLLHFQDQRAHIHRHKAQSMMRQHLPDYDKVLDGKSFDRIHAGYEDALRRARELAEEAARHGSPGRNPSTGVPALTESIRAGGAR
ncbi:RloB domain-containing protein [Polyangium spumosum]|uniref:RloB domain-containing protein n=1 Tax=Polyangium spumosum TaxID=889282 RepID=UPI00129A771B